MSFSSAGNGDSLMRCRRLGLGFSADTGGVDGLVWGSCWDVDGSSITVKLGSDSSAESGTNMMSDDCGFFGVIV